MTIEKIKSLTSLNLTTLSKKELKNLAREFFIPGFSRMTRDELLNGMKNIQNLYIG